MKRDSLLWNIVHIVTMRVFSHAAFKVLANQELTNSAGEKVRWLKPEIREFLQQLRSEARRLWITAGAEAIPTFGNRLMLLFAVYTASCDRVLRRMGIAPSAARQAFGDMAWAIYRRAVLVYSLPVRLVTRDAGSRLRWTMERLLRFPFSTPGIPGYAAEVRICGEDIETFFTHCPPNTYVRKLAIESGDAAVHDTFRASWCQFDWPLADAIAGDGRRGHYRRPHTLSNGDSVCDMCWMAKTRQQSAGDPRQRQSPSPTRLVT